MEIKKYNRGNGNYPIGSQASIRESESKSSSFGTQSTGDCNLWGNHFDGATDLEDTLFSRGSVYAMPSLFEGIDDDEEDDLPEGELPELKEREIKKIEGDNGGNIYAEHLVKSFGDVEGNAVYGKDIYLDVEGVKTNLMSLLMPVGSIIMYNGAAPIPPNWAICNGRNGTPDLTDRFIKAVTTKADVGKTGGQSKVTLTTENLPAHAHSYWDGDVKTDSSGGHVHSVTPTGNVTYIHEGNGDTITGVIGSLNQVNAGISGDHFHRIGCTESDTGSVGAGKDFDNEPPFYSLIFLMRFK